MGADSSSGNTALGFRSIRRPARGVFRAEGEFKRHLPAHHGCRAIADGKPAMRMALRRESSTSGREATSNLSEQCRSRRRHRYAVYTAAGSCRIAGACPASPGDREACASRKRSARSLFRQRSGRPRQRNVHAHRRGPRRRINLRVMEDSACHCSRRDVTTTHHQPSGGFTAGRIPTRIEDRVDGTIPYDSDLTGPRRSSRIRCSTSTMGDGNAPEMNKSSRAISARSS